MLKIIYVNVCASLCGYAHVCEARRVSDPLEPELEAVVRRVMGVLDTELRSSVRPVRSLSC